MHIIQNYTLKKNVVKQFLPLVMALLQGIKNLFGPLLMTWTGLPGPLLVIFQVPQVQLVPPLKIQ
jgi:hypothetical protein